MGRLTRALVPVLVVAALAEPAVPAATAELVRAAYVYDHMSLDHVDMLAQHQFDRAIVRLAGDSLGSGEAGSLRAWTNRCRARGVEPVPDFLLQAKSRLRERPLVRRYTWGSGESDREVGCPLDSLFWRSALLDRFESVLEAAPSVRRVAVDLEFPGGPPKHYDVGPCRCVECIAEYAGHRGPSLRGASAWRLSGLLVYQEARVFTILDGLMKEFAERHPGIEIGVFDLDLDSFVHRGLARALARNGIPVADYCERSYSVGGAPLVGARARLRALGLGHATLVGGLWLKRFAPPHIDAALSSITDRADGYFVFTTYSLANHPGKLSGPYTLLGSAADYWLALGLVNRR